MGYDLFLKPTDAAAASRGEPASDPGSPPESPSPDSRSPSPGSRPAGGLRAYLEGRPHYLIGEAAAAGSPTGARYAHADTGVTFTFDLAPVRAAGADAGPGGGGDRTAAAFGVDLLVPRFFARTAAEELAALCERFGLSVDDPQAGTSGPFDAAAFLASWERTAELAARHAAGRGQTPPALPADRLDAVHHWNRRRADWRARTPESGPGIPRVQLRAARTSAAAGGAGLVRTWCAWVDAAPIVLPPCDDVLLVRDALRPRRLGLFKAPEASLCLVPRASVVGRGRAGQRVGGPSEARAAGGAGCPGFGPAPERFPPGARQLVEPTKETVAWFRAPPADAAPPDALPPRAVIEAERLAAAVRS